MNILITSLAFRSLTGSEMYVYELSRELARAGHSVTVMSQVGGEIARRAVHNGVDVLDFQQASLMRALPDIIHLNQPHPSPMVLAMLPGVPAVQTVHSEAECESPVIDYRVREYVCIRPEIADHLVSEHQIARDRCTVVYNPIDFSRFQPSEAKPSSRRRVVFVGTIDPLRRNSILNLVERSVAEDFELTVVGQRHDDYLDGLDLPNVAVEPPTWDVERYVREADQTAGVLLGRTTIEGWACGKPGWIYDIDAVGTILGRELREPPSDLSRFDSREVAGAIVEVYHRALGSGRA